MWARGNGRQRIYLTDVDRFVYLRFLGQCVERLRWSCLAYCLMDNHVHLLLETCEPNLSLGMQRLHGRYAGDFNRRHRRSGHLFQGRFGSNRVTDDEQLLSTLGYIAANPVVAGLCDIADHWRWSSHGAIAAGCPPPWLDVAAVHAYLAPLGGDPRDRYRELVASRTS